MSSLTDIYFILKLDFSILKKKKKHFHVICLSGGIPALRAGAGGF